MSKKNTFKDEVVEEKKEEIPEPAPIAKPQKEKSKPKQAKVVEESKPSAFMAFVRDERTHKVFGLVFLLLSVAMFASFTSYFFSGDKDQGIESDIFQNTTPAHNWLGKIGFQLAHLFIYKWFGIASYLIAFVILVSSVRIVFSVSILPVWKTCKYSIFSILWISTSIGLIATDSSNRIFGGSFGYWMNKKLSLLIGTPGTIILLLFALVIFLVISFNISLKLPSFKRKEKEISDEMIPEPVILKKEEEKRGFGNMMKETMPQSTSIDLTNIEETEIGDEITEFDSGEVEEIPEPVLKVDGPALPPENKGSDTTLEVTEIIHEPEPSDLDPKTDYRGTLDTPFDPKLELSSYTFPSVELLENYGSNKIQVNNDELVENKNLIEKTLGHYDVKISKIIATIGPTVTLYEIIPVPGTRIAKIKNLEDDIALSLSALGIRIIAPMPGRGTIGIEVPNSKPEMVSMRSIIASDKFRNADFDLPIALGKTISNEVFVADLAKMPHLLMAGATGQGKSVGLNAVLISLLYAKHPSQVKFVLVDPKKVELSLFKKIERHFLAKLPGDKEDAIITDTHKVIKTLKSLCTEMDTRYDLLKDAEVRNIKEYNTKFIARKLNPENGHRFLPYIVLVVDEFADLIMTAGKEIEQPIARLAQLSRAIGIHLIIATQRPSVNIITGTIKANFPARIAFRVSSKIDSRTILDASGAHQLIGKGDMLLSFGAEPVRIQCAFVDTVEVERVTAFIGSQRGYPDAYRLPEVHDDESSDGPETFDASDQDALFTEAAKIVVLHQQGSASILQRKLKLGYNRAGRIIDQLEAAGIVGPFEGSKGREVLVKDIVSLEQFLSNLHGSEPK